MLSNAKRWPMVAFAGMAVSMLGWATAPARPGTVNYVEGRASLDGQTLAPKSAGQAEVQEGQVLSTRSGRAEILLTPGVFLRIGENSAVRMVSPGLTDTRVQVLQGEALVEATDIHKENHIQIGEDRSSTDLLKNGLYRFYADRDTVAVFDGKAIVMSNDQQVEVKGGREVNLRGPLTAVKFDKKADEKADPLYRWSKVRSGYLSESSAQLAQSYFGNGGLWSGSGWYWDPWWHTWSYLPGAALYSPFGWGFYGPPAYYYYRPRVRIVRPVPYAGVGVGRRRR